LAKNPTEIMEIFASYDLTRCAWSAAQLVGCDPKTVQRYVDLREAGLDPFRRTRRARLIDPYLEKVEELVERSKGKIRADVTHDRLRAMGFAGNERTTRRAVAAAKAAYRAGRRRTYRPWLPEPGMWLQFDWAEGPRVAGRQTQLFCAWLAWSRYRVVLPTWDRKLGTLLACLDATLRRLQGGPTYLLTDNERTVTTDRVAGVPVRHPVLVAAGRHYGLEVQTCVVADPESKGGSEATVRVAKADLVPTEANLLDEYASFGELAAACERFCTEVNGRPHSETGRAPVDALAEERGHLHMLPREPYTAALGETRTVEDDQTVRYGSVRYSTPPGWVGQQVWCRVEGEELVIVGPGESGLQEVWRHQLSVPGRPQIVDEHYPDHPKGRGTLQPRVRPQREEERVFLAIGEGAERWLRAAAASGAVRVRAKMSQATELALLFGSPQVDEALRRAADAGRFGEDDLVSILSHSRQNQALHVVRADESYSAQPGTSAWAEFGRRAG
jgi:transposase